MLLKVNLQGEEASRSVVRAGSLGADKLNICWIIIMVGVFNGSHPFD